MHNKDADYRRWITSRRWGELRRRKLTASPLCQRCKEQERITAACEVHHIRPVESGVNKAEQERLMFNPLNLMALCHNCHVEIHLELGHTGKKATQKRNIQKVNDIISRFFPSSDPSEPPTDPPGGIF